MVAKAEQILEENSIVAESAELFVFWPELEVTSISGSYYRFCSRMFSSFIVSRQSFFEAPQSF